ncbi:hypothetical protein MMG00_02955 [Ignatzschineria rhizosphaerae]|uniref:Uncharacterized protein n=1 Tax=Ignatzschineria rhizosphaerae TaxID=2923279 RepID=A0ABY3X4Z4_9GAMM|nr:hypothetical protein [Ignatzschineria rhizosphaerae]UNM96831.1 hypothetical protein MMG00_02955 [Ignatzschineria rhizosphaerae]
MKKYALIYSVFISILCLYSFASSHEILELSTIKASEGALLLCDESNVTVKLASSSSLKEVVM